MQVLLFRLMITVLLAQKLVATMKWFLLLVILVVILVAASYSGYKGLMWLSDWMNEVEEQRLRRSYPRI